MAQTLYGFGWLARARNDDSSALRHFASALALYREIDARPEIARCLAGIGSAALSHGDMQLARSSLSECLQLSLATGQRLAMARGLEAFAVMADMEGDPERVARLHGAALARLEAIGEVPSSLALNLVDSAHGDLDAALLAEGREMTAYEAVRFAIGPMADRLANDVTGDDPAAGHPVPSPGSSRAGSPSVLTVRELEIATLIARGLPNRSIADALVISPATAARHVANIFTKLGFSSRAQVAAWVVERQSADVS